MAKPFSSDDVILPPGLFVSKADGVFWWTRRGQPRARKSYAVCVQSRSEMLEVSALPIVGHLEKRLIGPHQMRIAAMHWLVRSETDKKVFRSVYEYARDSTMLGMCDSHWFRIRANSPEEAKSHPDVLFVLKHIRHYKMTHAFRGIYFISNGSGAVKIGRTGSSLATRLNACQVGSPHELYVVAAIEAGDIAKAERRLHKEHKARHLRGEWFSMDDATAICIAESLGGRKWAAESLSISNDGEQA